MPPKKAAAKTATSKVTKKTAAKTTSPLAPEKKATKAAAAKAAAPKPVEKSAPAPKKTAKRKADDSEADETAEQPKAKKTKTEEKPAVKANKAAPKKAAAKPVANKKGRPAKKEVEEPESASESESQEEPEEEIKPAPKKAAATKKAAAPKKAAAKPAVKKAPAAKHAIAEEESSSESEPEPAPKKIAPLKKAAAPKKATAPKAKPAKVLPVINVAPTQVLDVYVFGEGSSGELGLGAFKGADGKKVIDVTRPRLNPKLSAKDVGVVALGVGGMHCIALTKDNKILTWGVNDQGALGRDTPQEGKMKDIGEGNEDSDSDSDDDDSGLNPSEAEPRAVDPVYFEEGTKFAAVFAGDSSSWAVTTTGLVYGWGTFRSNDGILGFRDNIRQQMTPVLIPELKNIKTMAVGTNHVIALDSKGKTTIWGAGEQGQLARRVVSRTAKGALIPREFGLQRKKIVVIGAGDYHSFAIDDKGNVYAWGLNTFGQTGVPKDEETEENTVGAPTLVSTLKDFDIKQIAGGAHHTLACTKTGQVIIWGRIDTKQGGMEIEKMDQESIFFDENKKPRFLTKPAVIPGINAAYVATANDTCLVVDLDGKAYSWGFSSNYQTGQGSDEDVVVATHVDNSALKGKKLTFAGLGGQFGILAGDAVDTPMTNGV